MHFGAKRSHNALQMYVQEHQGVPGSKKRLRCSGLGEVAHLFSLLSCWMWASAAPFDCSREAIRSRCTERGSASLRTASTASVSWHKPAVHSHRRFVSPES